jgi:acyl-CoA synthetase (AMP-forming)/AMP-acid ligase II
MLIDKVLADAAAKHANKEAVVFGDRRLSYAEYEQNVETVAQGLIKLGLRPGDRVAMVLPNWPEFLFCFFGTIRAGGVVVALTTLLRPREMDFILRDAGVSVVFSLGDYRGRDITAEISGLRANLPSLQHVVAVSPSPSAVVSSFQDFLKLRDQSSQQAVVYRGKSRTENDLVCILYTSGTTGEPKGAMHTHKSILHTVSRFTAHVVPADSRILGTMPLCHSGGMVLQFLPAVIQAGTLIIMEKFDPDEALGLVQSEKINYFPGVPTMYSRMLMRLTTKGYDLSSLKRVLASGALVPPELVKAVRNQMKCEILVGYGLSECQAQPICTAPGDSEEVIAETIGRPLSGYEVRIVDDKHIEAPKGVAIRSPAVMVGYWNRPEMTEKTIDGEGWLYTGDLALVDHEGYIRITGRKSEMYIRGGYNVFPRETENVLHSHPGVAIAAVFGIPDRDLGERGIAVVVPKKGTAIIPGELRSYCRERLVHYKVPDEIIVREEVPMTAIGKVLKRELRKEILRKNSEEMKLK